jgi:hypothetical protein
MDALGRGTNPRAYRGGEPVMLEPTHPQQTSPGPYVFLSYASADREQELRVADLLTERGLGVWIDRQSIAGEPGILEMVAYPSCITSTFL